MTLGLIGKVVIITGGASGIGRATALAFAQEGCKVVVADVSVEAGEATVQSIQTGGGDAIFIKTDVSKASDVRDLVSKTVSYYGKLDCAFNNAGIEGKRATTAACTEENWDRVMDINLKGVWLCMKYQIPHLRQQGGGVIVNMASVAGLSSGLQGYAAYCASKHGVVGLTKLAAVEYAKTGIRINAICPGFIETPLLKGDPEQFSTLQAWVSNVVPTGRFGTPEEVAKAVVWMCSDQTTFMNGHTLVVDGGFVAQ